MFLYVNIVLGHCVDFLNYFLLIIIYGIMVCNVHSLFKKKKIEAFPQRETREYVKKTFFFFFFFFFH